MQRFPARIRQIEGNRPITTPSFFSKRSRPPWKEGRLCIIMGKKMGAYAPVAAGAAGRGNNHLGVQLMANTNRVKVDILGSSYFITTTESEEYIHGLEDSLNEMLGQLLERHTSVSINNALIITCLNLLDSCRKSEETADHLRGQLTDYLEDAARARIELDEVKRELDKANRELALLRKESTGR